jgi:transcriptional regulator with XRE-family HTH domain
MDRAAERALDQLRMIGRELRTARMDRGLSTRTVATAMGCSHTKIVRIDHAQSPDVTLLSLNQYGAAVGLDISVRAFAGGSPLREAGHTKLLLRFRARVHVSIGWANEVPFPIFGDQRAWDAMLRGPSWRYGVEGETGPRDGQALGRRLELKRRDGGVDGIILVLPATRRSREFLAAAGPLLRTNLPLDGRVILKRLEAGLDPGGSGIVLV